MRVFSHDSERLVSAHFENVARVWDTNTGHQILVLSGHENIVRSAEFSQDGTRIVTSSQDGTARVWDGRTGSILLTLNASGEFFNYARFSPDGRVILTFANDGTTRIWDSWSYNVTELLNLAETNLYESKLIDNEGEPQFLLEECEQFRGLCIER